MDVDIDRMIVNDEGKRLYTYLDTKNILTVGIGHNLKADPALDILGKKLLLGDRISERQCQVLFNRDLSKVLNKVMNIPGYMEMPFKYNCILINMCFQMGYSGLLKFVGTIKAMRDDKPDEVVKHIMDSNYAKQAPNRAKRMCMLARGIVPDEYKPID